MIISASRRTDIPRFHTDWLVNRLNEGYVDIRNPYHPEQVSRYSLDPSIVDGIVLWTKDPSPMLDKLDALAPYPFYFQFTLTPYGKRIEPHVRDKHDLIRTFQELAEKVGPERVIWRFDPIFINDTYTIDYHVRSFKTIAEQLHGCTDEVIISFLDQYTGPGRNVFYDCDTRAVSVAEQNELAARLSEIAHGHSMAIKTCAEAIDLKRYGIEHARCIDGERFARLGARLTGLAKDKSQRKVCGCIESLDIGAYNTCLNGCRYCYATKDFAKSARIMKCCDPTSSMLVGRLCSTDKLTDHRGTGDWRDRSYRS